MLGAFFVVAGLSWMIFVETRYFASIYYFKTRSIASLHSNAQQTRSIESLHSNAQQTRSIASLQ